MRNLSFFTLFLIGCSTFKPEVFTQREIASVRKENPVLLSLQLSQSVIFASGYDPVMMKIQLKDSLGETIVTSPKEIKIFVDYQAAISEVTFEEGVYKAKLTPVLKSPELRVLAKWKDHLSKVVVLKTTVAPIRSAMSNSDEIYIAQGVPDNKLSIFRQEKTHLTQQLTLTNSSPHTIIQKKASQRTYDFRYPHQSSQNLGMSVSDQLTESGSDFYNSNFSFFPRKNLFLVENLGENEFILTLPTGEEVTFSNINEIKSGILEEAPLDHTNPGGKKLFPQIKYNGKGILLRVNAKANHPLLTSKPGPQIDNEYGHQNEAGALIINGTTGERCHRPKKDFWEQGNVKMVRFKFPDDDSLNDYLKKNCGFEIPEMEGAQLLQLDSSEPFDDLWKKCKDSDDVKQCLIVETNYIEHPHLKARLKFEGILKVAEYKKIEALRVESVLLTQLARIHSTLLKDASWLKKGCFEQGNSLVKNTLQYHDIYALIESPLRLLCESIATKMDETTSLEIESIKTKLESDFSWTATGNKTLLSEDCLKQVPVLLDGSQKYSSTPEIYHSKIKKMCENIDSSPSYVLWLKTQSTGLEDKLFIQSRSLLEGKAEYRAKQCLRDFPMETAIDSLRDKKARENCLIREWPRLENEIFQKLAEDTIVKKVALSLDPLRTKLALEARSLQLKTIKKYFTSP